MRRTPSRRMPPYQPHFSPVNLLVGFGCGIGLLGIVGVSAFFAPWETLAWIAILSGLFAAGAVLTLVMNRLDRPRQIRLATLRQGESICSFARSFNCRQTDTWIIRAVYEEFQPDVAFSIRRTDHFEDDLRIDCEDLGFYVERIAQRTGRDLARMEENPWYYQVQTIDSLIMFLHAQPRKPAAQE